VEHGANRESLPRQLSQLPMPFGGARPTVGAGLESGMDRLGTGILVVAEQAVLPASASDSHANTIPRLLFDTPWCSVDHLAVGSTRHRVRMEREAHTLILFDGGSYCTEGERCLDGSRAFLTGPLDGGVDVVPAGCRLTATSGTASNVGCTLITLDADYLAACIEMETNAQGEVLQPRINMRNDLITTLASRIRRWSVVDESDMSAMQRETTLMLLVLEVVRLQRAAAAQGKDVPRGGLSSRRRRLVREFVAANLDTRIDLQMLADCVGMSRFHFSRAFKTSFGLPPHKYLMGERIRLAAERLRNSADSITDISLQVGFSCSSELTRLFRQTIGCTPREYRARIVASGG